MTPYYEEDGITIYCQSARDPWPVEEQSVACVVFSPPYNVGIDYADHDDVMAWTDYRILANDTLNQVRRALFDGGRCWVNITPVVPAVPIEAGDHSGRGKNPRVSLLGLWTNALEGKSLPVWDYVCWPTMGRGPSTAWGSWQSPAGPNMRGEWEVVIAAYRGTWDRQRPDEFHGWQDKLGGWTALTSNVWKMQPENRNGHPAPFPVELAQRAIRLSSFPGELIADPFMGSGSSLVAARDLGRRAIGFEISEEYCELAVKRLAQGVLI